MYILQKKNFFLVEYLLLGREMIRAKYFIPSLMVVGGSQIINIFFFFQNLQPPAVPGPPPLNARM